MGLVTLYKEDWRAQLTWFKSTMYSLLVLDQRQSRLVGEGGIRTQRMYLFNLKRLLFHLQHTDGRVSARGFLRRQVA